MNRVSPAAAAMHVAVIWSFAVARPLFETLADDPSFFIGRGSTTLDIVIFAVALIALPAAIAFGLLAGLRRARPGWIRPTSILLIGAAGVLLGLQLAKQISPSAGALTIFAVGGLAGAGLAAGYARTEFVPSILTVLGPAPLLFAALFLFTAPISKLVFPSEPAPPAERVSSDAAVVFVVFDELPLATLLRPGGEIDGSRFPAFAELAAESRWYRGAVTVSSFTHVAIPAMLTGEIGETRVPSAAVHPKTVFAALSESHRMDVVEPVTELCPERACGEREREGFAARMSGLAEDLFLVEKHRLLPESITVDLPPIDQGFAHFVDLSRSRELVRASNEFAARLGERGPVLHYLHNPFLPHPPWEILPDGTRYEPVLSNAEFEEGERGDLTGGPGAIATLWQRHLLQAGYADRLLGRMIATMKRAGTWDEATVIVVSDHGASFKLGASRRTVGSRSLGGIGPVPLFVKAPGGARAGSVSDSLTCITRVPELISRALGVKPELREGECVREPEFFDGAGAKRISRSLNGVVATQAGLFRPGGGWEAVWGALDGRGLIGAQVSALRRGDPIDVTAELRAGFAHSPSGEELPRSPLLVAETSGPLPPRARVAVAIDGTIVAVGAPFRALTGDGIAAMIEPRRISDGELELFLVAPGGAAPLRPIGLG